MNLWPFLCAAVLLSLERFCYGWIWRSPAAFQALCNRPAMAFLGAPVAAIRKLFYVFKVLQGAVFVGWCLLYGEGTLWPTETEAWALAGGGFLLAAGQMLNVSVFYHLRQTGAFYGNKFGYEIPWCHLFPFSLLKHPQYIGAVLSIWGFFLIMRFPHSDWYWLPMLETVYYLLAAAAEN